MLRWLLAGFLIAHGFVHIAVWTSKRASVSQGARADHSWLMGDQHSLVVVITYAVVGLFVLAGGALLFQWEIWGAITLVAAGVSLLLVALFPEAILNAWIVAPVGINVALLVSMLWLEWPTRGAFAI